MCEIKIELLEYLVQCGTSPAHANCQKPEKFTSLNQVRNYIEDQRDIKFSKDQKQLVFIVSISLEREKN